MAIRLNYNDPSGAEKAYKSAIRKLKKNLYSGEYGKWLSTQKAIREAAHEAESDLGYIPPQTTWLDVKALSDRFIHKIVTLICIHKIFSYELEKEEE